MSYIGRPNLCRTGSSKRVVIPSGSLNPYRSNVIEVPLRTNVYTLPRPAPYVQHFNANRIPLTPSSRSSAQASTCNSCGQDLSQPMLGNLTRTIPSYPTVSTPIRPIPMPMQSPSPTPIRPIPSQTPSAPIRAMPNFPGSTTPMQGNLNMTPPNVTQFQTPMGSSFRSPYAQTPSQPTAAYRSVTSQYQSFPASPPLDFHSSNCPLNHPRYNPNMMPQQRLPPRPYFDATQRNQNITKEEIAEIIDEKFKTIIEVIKNPKEEAPGSKVPPAPIKRQLFNDEEACEDKMCNTCGRKKTKK